MITENSLKCYY